MSGGELLIRILTFGYMSKKIKYKWKVGKEAYYNDGYEGESKMKSGNITGIDKWCLYPTYIIKGNSIREDQIHTALCAPTPAEKRLIEFWYDAPESVEDYSYL